MLSRGTNIQTGRGGKLVFRERCKSPRSCIDRAGIEGWVESLVVGARHLTTIYVMREYRVKRDRWLLVLKTPGEGRHLVVSPQVSGTRSSVVVGVPVMGSSQTNALLSWTFLVG